jgi:hypothetical protein
VQVTATTTSISKTTGSLIAGGGLGVAENAYIGGILNVALTATLLGVTSVTDATESADTTTGALKVTGGGVFGKNLRVGGNAFVGGALDSTGALTLASTLTSTDTTQATIAGDGITPNAGSILTNGGLGVKLKAFFGGEVQVGVRIKVPLQPSLGSLPGAYYLARRAVPVTIE